jgi:excisionase family DNA binding protein
MHGEAPTFLGSTCEAANYLRVANRTLSRWRSLGVGPAYIRVGGKIFYQRRDLDAWLEKRRVQPVREDP